LVEMVNPQAEHLSALVIFFLAMLRAKGSEGERNSRNIS
jgi:hypothetical protein